MTPRIVTIDYKAPYEVIPVTFDFSALVGSITSATVSITVKTGTDPGVGSMLFGSYVLSGLTVRQLVQNGLNNVIYLLRANIVSGNEKYSLACYLPVVEIV